MKVLAVTSATFQSQFMVNVPISICIAQLQERSALCFISLIKSKALAGLFPAAWQHPSQCLSAWALALAACWGIQLRLVSFTRLAAAMISCLLTSSPSPSPQRCARCERACEGLGLQVGASMMSCKIFKQSCKVQVQRFYQRDKTKS